MRPVGLEVHRVRLRPDEEAARQGIPVTTPARTLIDLASVLEPERLERVVNQADKLDLVDLDALRDELDGHRRARGIAALREILDPGTHATTDSVLEQRFLRIARRAGLPRPETGVHLNGFVVDFYWPDLGLVVETDGLRYHRTASQQSRDRRRDQAHAAAGLTTLRFTHQQVTREAPYVEETLAKVALRLASRAA